jgi:hypothetical protein
MTTVRVDALEALLVIVDHAIAVAEPREVAALSREKRQLLSELESLAAGVKGSPIDDIARRREARLAKAPARAPTPGSGQQRRKRSG